MYGLVSSQELWIGEKVPKLRRTSGIERVISWWTIPWTAPYSRSNVLRRHTRRRQKFWTWFQDYPVVLDKWCRERTHASQNERCTSIFHLSGEMFQWFGSDYRAHEDPNIGNQLTIQFLPLERNLHGHPLAGLPWEKVPGWECLYVHRKKAEILDSECWRHEMAGQTQNMPKICATAKETDLEDPVSFTDQVCLGCTQRAAQVNNITVMEKLISTSTDVKTEEKNPKDIIAWSQHMEGHGQKVCWTLLRSGAQDDWPRFAWTITK